MVHVRYHRQRKECGREPPASVRQLLPYPCSVAYMIAFHSNQPSLWYVHPTSQQKSGWRNAFLVLMTLQSRTIRRILITRLQLGPPAQLESKCGLKVSTHSYCVLSGRMAPIWSRTVCKISLTVMSLTPDIVLTPSILDLSRAGEVTQPPSQSPQSKRKRVSSSTSGERHIKVCNCLIPGQCHWVW